MEDNHPVKHTPSEALVSHIVIEMQTCKTSGVVGIKLEVFSSTGRQNKIVEIFHHFEKRCSSFQ